MTSERVRIGKLGEQEAYSRLIQDGYIIVERNWRCRSGELDLIARKDERLIFIEVRVRRNSHSLQHYGTAAESVNARKQMQVRNTAQVYLQSRSLHQVPIRFDVITMTIGKLDHIDHYRHYESAF